MHGVSGAEPQGADDLLSNSSRCAASKRESLWHSQLIAHPSQLPVAGAKIMAPLSYAVSLVDHQKARSNAGGGKLRTEPVEPLGGDIQQAQRSSGDAGAN